jgi:hypothetical protein
MPTVRAQQRVAPTALPGVRVSTDTPAGAFGVAAPLDLSGPAKLAAQITDQARQEADATQLVASDNRLHELKASVERDIFAKYRGIDALGARDAAREAWEKGVAEIGQGVKGGSHVTLAFQQRAGSHYADLLSTVESHAEGEYKSAQTREFAAAADNRTATAVTNYADPQKRQLAIDEGRILVSTYAKQAGWSAEETRAKLDLFTSNAHASIIERMVNDQQDVAAEAYLKEHRAELSGKDLADAERLTGEASVLGKAQRASDQILATAPDLLAGLDEAAKLPNARVREAAEHRIRQGFADRAADERQQQMQAFHSASAIVEKTGSFDAIPLKVRMAMSPEENNALAHRVDQIRHPKEPGDPDTYFHLLNLASLSPESRSQFMKENLTPAGYPNLSASERQKLMTLQRQLSVRSEGATETHQSREMLREAEAEQQRTDHLNEAELRKTDPTAAEKLRAENFAKRQAKYHGATHSAPSTSGAVSGAAAATGPSAAHPLAGLLTPAVPARPATPAMLEDVAKKGPGYAKYLRDMGYDVPSGAAAPPVVPPAPARAPAPAPRPISAAPVQMAPAVVMAQPPAAPPAPAPVAATMAPSTATLAPINITAPATPPAPATKRAPSVSPAANAPTPAKPVPGVPYEKSGHMVVDTPRADTGGHVPTHRIDQITNRKPHESWTQYEDRVLGAKSKAGDEAIHSELRLLEPDVREAATSMIAAAKADGITLEPKETVRTQARQEHLFRKGRSTPGEVVTWTLTSDHTPGRAIDFGGGARVIKWIREHATEFGFTTLGDLDPGHVSIPQRPATLASSGSGR